jgi:hypothetical protein
MKRLRTPQGGLQRHHVVMAVVAIALVLNYYLW